METGRDHWQITYVMRLSLEDKNSKLTRTKPFEKKRMLGVIILIFFVGHSLYGFRLVSSGSFLYRQFYLFHFQARALQIQIAFLLSPSHLVLSWLV